MKKWWVIGIIVIFLLFFLWLIGDDEYESANNGANSTNEPIAEQPNEVKSDRELGEGYTFLVYMNGSDLESTWYEDYDEYGGAATIDLQEMINGVSSDNVNVIVETGGTLAWNNDLIDPEQNQRWMVGSEGLVHLEDVGRKNMGESETLSDFIEWGVTNYPANNYALVFWNHGGGSVLGFAVDEWFDGDGLTLDEIETGLATAYDNTGAVFELIGFDACLMATVETAALISQYAHYMVASQELEPGHGWDYTGIMSYLSNNSSADGAQLGQVIVDTYEQHAIYYEQEKSITLSVTDLSKIDEVVTALEAFVAEAGSAISVDRSDFYSLADGRRKAEDYGSFGDDAVTDMTDLASIARNVASQYPITAANLEQAIHNAVVYNLNSVSRPDASGLSIYFPHKDKANFDENLSRFYSIGFSDAYNSFVDTYVSLLTSDKMGVKMISSNKDEFNFEYGADESEYFEVYIDPSDLERIEQIYGVVMMVTEDSDTVLFLGYDHYVNMDWETGLLQDDFTGEWLTWNGNFVSLFLVSQGENYNRYSIPAILNGQEVEIIVHFDWDTEEYEVLGASKGISETTGMPDRNIINLKPGDEIVPLYYYYTESTDEDGYTEGEPFILEGTNEFVYEFLPNGSYLYGFSIVDYAGNETDTDYIEFELTD